MMNITRFWKFTISQGLLVKYRETEVQHNKIIDFSVLNLAYKRIRLSMYKKTIFYLHFLQEIPYSRKSKLKYLKYIYMCAYKQL